jgi:hypothetical protein
MFKNLFTFGTKHVGKLLKNVGSGLRATARGAFKTLGKSINVVGG